jgi:hypothetical protein
VQVQSIDVYGRLAPNQKSRLIKDSPSRQELEESQPQRILKLASIRIVLRKLCNP